jgi:ketosteroid isomerase-like protein
VGDKGCELVEALEGEWRDALCTKDMDRLRLLVHPDFVLIGTCSSGPFTMGRDEWLEAIQRRDVDTIDLSVSDATVFQEVMVGTVPARRRIKYLGRTIEDCVLLTDVWVFEDGRWQAIRRHSTPASSFEPVDMPKRK